MFRILFLCCLFSFSAIGNELKIDFSGHKINGHLQGVALAGKSLYLSFTGSIARYDFDSKTLKTIQTPVFDGIGEAGAASKALRERYNIRRHHSGAPCFVDGKLYVAYSGSGFNMPLNGKYSYNYVYVFDSELNFIGRHHVPDLQYGAGAVTFANGKFYLAGGRPNGVSGNTIYEFDRNFKLQREILLPFNSRMGIQTLYHDGKYFWVGCYGDWGVTYQLDDQFKIKGVYNFDSSVGAHLDNNGTALKTFYHKWGKNKKLLSVCTKNKKLADHRLRVMNCFLTADGKIICDGKETDIAGLNKVFLQAKKAKKGTFVFVRLDKNVPGRAAVDIILLAAQSKLPCQVISYSTSL